LMKRGSNAILFAGAAVFFGWVIWHFGKLIEDDGGVVRVVLGIVLAFPVIFRWKRRDDREKPLRPICVSALAGMVLVVCGLIIPIHQLEWLGLVLLFYACLAWSLPASYSRDIFLGVFLLYWIHPLPGQVFAKLQLLMQWLSVNGAEWALHCANVRSWADGFFLRTGTRVFKVPGDCSGMRTAVTVLMSTLGVGMLLRLKWYEVIPFLLLGLLQVLVLNVARIVFMVIWSARMPIEWAEHFLHDSLGWFLLIAIVLTQLEASWWKVSRDRGRRRKEAIERGDVEPPDMATFLPRFWMLAQRWGWLVLLILFLVVGAMGAVYKRRDAHRSVMVGGIVEDLMVSDPAVARRAVDAAIRLAPKAPRHMFSLKARILGGLGAFEEAVAEFDRLPGELSALEVVHKARALMELKRGDEAVALINGLPRAQQRLPGVAIIKAEYGVQRDEPKVVKNNTVLAAQHRLLLPRVRALFPYLAAHKMWQVIVDADRTDTDYDLFAPALVAVHANLKMNNIGGAADTLKRAVRTWPDDRRLLTGLFELAIRRPQGGWEGMFARNLRANLQGESSKLGAGDSERTDRLATYINYCFRLRRPDLAWLSLVRLAEIDPADPAISLAAARFGPLWFTSRKCRVGLPARNVNELGDLSRFYLLTRDVEPMKSMWSRVPLADEMARGVGREAYRRHIDRCLAELERRRKESRLSVRMERMYPAVLAMAGRYEDAHALLQLVAEESPARKAEALLQRALLYDSRGRLDEAYEMARMHVEAVDTPVLTGYLLLANALLSRNMGAYTLEMLSRARDAFPDALEVDVAEAAVWDIFGAKDQALFALARRGAGLGSLTVVRLLYETGRVREARKLGRGLGVKPVPDREVRGQGLKLPPAELAVTRNWGDPLPEEEMARREKESRARASASRSPFFRAVARLEADWYTARGKGMTWDPDRWRAAGRDNLERASAIHRLVLLLARNGEYGRAFEAATQAMELLPKSAALWRVLVALKEGDAETVKRARAHCPDDPEIWLASIVSGVRGGHDAKWAAEEMLDATTSGKFPAGTIVRASDFLLRKGMDRAAAVGAKHAVENGRGLPAAYALGVMCAARTDDAKWAQTCAMAGADHALDPRPFFEVLVLVKSAMGGADGDLIHALEYLQSTAVTDTKWDEKLGGVYFEKGDTGRVLSILGPLIDKDVGSVRINSLLLAAEAARMQGNAEKAIDILWAAHKAYPRRSDVLNNLVYNLAQDAKTLGRATELLPTLLELDSKSAAVLDTAAMIYLKSGRIAVAWRYMEKALDRVVESDYAALEIQLNAAEIRYRVGDHEDARARVEAVLNNPARSGMLERRAKGLLARIKAKLKEQG